MYILKNALKVGGWGIVNKSLFTKQDEQINQFDLLGNFQKTIYQIDKNWAVKYYDTFFQNVSMYSENTIVDYEGKVLYYKNDFTFYHFYSKDRYIGFDWKIKKTVNSKGKILYDKKMFKKVFYNDLIIFTNEFISKSILLLDLNHPEKPLWQFNLSQFGTYYYIGDNLAYEVVQFIGIWNNLLLVQLTNARLIALDIETGALKKDLEINKTNPLETPLFYDYYSKMHLVEDKIIWLSNQSLLHIDLHTFSTKEIKEYYSVPREEQWQFKHITYFDGKLYFTADYAWQYVTPTHIGVMDANTGEVLWSTQLKKTGGLPEAPKVTKDKLYIRTSTAMLHIFEKQKNETT